MNPITAILVLGALVAVTALLGLLWRARSGRVRAADGAHVSAAELGDGARLGTGATIVQFSTEFCGPCRVAERMLKDLAGERDGVVHLDLDLAAQPHLAARFGIVQTPTILLLDAAGGIRSRIGGVPRADEVARRLDEISKESHVAIG